VKGLLFLAFEFWIRAEMLVLHHCLLILEKYSEVYGILCSVCMKVEDCRCFFLIQKRDMAGRGDGILIEFTYEFHD
jgi:hypothetical protein